VTVVGEVPPGAALTRSGASAGDDIYVSGTLGDAALALAALRLRTTLAPDALSAARQRLEAPEPRVGLGLRLRGVATAALDISDGLTGDVAHILESSRVGARIDLAMVPRMPALAAQLTGGERALALSCLLAGGDDYELCFTANPASRDRIAGIAADLALPLTRIGAITATPGLDVRDESGRTFAAPPRAFDHFAS
jgi:thiamine-monophosphate kinase